MNSVGIVGGGIAGLSAAWNLSNFGIPFTLYESSNRLGGMIGSTMRDGFLVERGPSTVLETSPRIGELIAALGIENRRVFPNAEAKRRYIVRSGQLHALPQGVLDFVKTPLLSTAAKARVALEPAIRRCTELDDETVSRFVERRLGREILDYFVDPFVGGVYAGDPARLSVAHAFPKLHELERKYGSLIAGSVLGARERARSAVKSKRNARMFSFDGGLQVLVDALQNSAKDRVQLGCLLTAVQGNENVWRLEFLNGSVVEHAAVLLCAPAHRLAQISVEAGLELQFLKAISYPPIARVTLGFKREQVRHPLDGFGALAPAKEGLELLGVFFSSSLFAGRAPQGHVALTVFLGGARDPQLCCAGQHVVAQAAISNMQGLLGIEGGPVFQDFQLIPRSIPQYELGFGKLREAMTQFEQRRPGLFLAGNYRDGVSVSDSIVSGLSSSERIKEFLGNAEQGNSVDQHRVA